MIYDTYPATRDHPHACGDKDEKESVKAGITGSSPRVWGQVNILKPNLYSRGIIPTRVGTSLILQTQKTQIKDHPHACGDKDLNYRRHGKRLGSSPRVWGQVYVNAIKLIPYRIIPTRVGTRRG